MVVKVVIHPKEEGKDVPPTELLDEMEAAGWDAEDPGQGVAIILEDGREVLNPVPMAPPVGYVPQDTLMTMMERMLRTRLYELGLMGDEVVDSEEEANDFGDDDDEGDIWSGYEVSMQDEYPEFKGKEPEYAKAPDTPPDPPPTPPAATPPA